MEKFFGGESLETQYRHRQGYVKRGYELRILDGVYGKRLIYRGELGALMGGDRSYSTLEEMWNSLPIYSAEVSE